MLGFLADACEVKPSAWADKAEMAEVYAHWCRVNDEQPLSKHEFGVALKSRGIKPKRAGHSNTAVWLGIRLNPGVLEASLKTRQVFRKLSPSTCIREQLPEQLSHFVARGANASLNRAILTMQGDAMTATDVDAAFAALVADLNAWGDGVRARLERAAGRPRVTAEVCGGRGSRCA